MMTSGKWNFAFLLNCPFNQLVATKKQDFIEAEFQVLLCKKNKNLV